MKTIRDYRIEAGLKQVDVEKLVGISQKSISSIELGQRKPTKENLRILAKIYNVDYDDILSLFDSAQIREPDDPIERITKGAEIPTKLRECRIAAGISVQEAADKIGIQPSTMENYERGISNPSIEFLNIVSELYDCEPDDLLDTNDYRAKSLEGYIKNYIEGIRNEPFKLAEIIMLIKLAESEMANDFESLAD